MDFMHLLFMVFIGLVGGAVLTSIELPLLKKHQFRQYIREEGPESHKKKAGTPTMGGIAMILSMLIASLIGGGITRDMLAILGLMLSFGLMGFLDDYIKVAAKHNLGLRAKQKLAIQIVLAIIFGIYVTKVCELDTEVYIPFYNDYVDFGWMYVPFIVFVIVAMANSVNLTDGLDGLCSGITAIVCFTFGLMAIKLDGFTEMVFLGVMCGTCLGFLIFNKNPAKLFMGDTGSMALGAGLAAAAILLKMEFLLIIAGFIYVAESGSVILQVISFQSTGKRIFRMSPIHHHFELGGMKEVNVVFMFWGVTLVCSALAYMVFLAGV